MSRAVLHAAVTSGLLLAAGSASAQLAGSTLASGFVQPLFVTSTPDDSSVLYVVEKAGRIKTIDANTGQSLGTFLDITGITSDISERGLLGMAFAPDYATSGEFYISYTNTSGTSVLARYQRSSSDPLVADTSSKILAQVAQPQSNHNGGWLGFNPVDDTLYWSIGDGGSSNDLGIGHTPGIGNGQDTNNRLGAMLRYDVAGTGFFRNASIPADNPFVGSDDGDEAIVAWGLRNGYRASFDRETGDLYIGDVGQNRREEV
ncbi:MAG: PQQ-dependent sugar dehydrogenase, partial [Planctomycetota bacterium]